MTNTKRVLTLLALAGAAVNLSGTAQATSDGGSAAPDGKAAIHWGAEDLCRNTNEQRYDVKGLIAQSDYNAVLYTKSGEAIWHTNTAAPSGNDTCVATILNSGRFVIRKGTGIYEVGPKKD
ncbi:hypothetical protein ACFWAT_31945 [Streptomyces syringium]|uniref:hypothetical protein n=1 Tax=Streptomyces syringium TaxID=76729 RepID=UPI003649E144